MVKIIQESSLSHKIIRPLSAKKINPIKSPKKKSLKSNDSSKVLRRVSPKINSIIFFESSTVRNTKNSGQTLSSEHTLSPPKMNQPLILAEKELSDLKSFQSKMDDDLLHLKSMEQLNKQKKKQISQLKSKVLDLSKEKSDLIFSMKPYELILKEFTKKMEKGFLTADEKKKIYSQIQELNQAKQKPVVTNKDAIESQLTELWELIPRTLKLMNKLKTK